MSKSFDDFDGLIGEEIEELADQAAEIIDIDWNGDMSSIPIYAVPSFSVILSKLVADETLRKYHEWMSEEA